MQPVDQGPIHTTVFSASVSSSTCQPTSASHLPGPMAYRKESEHEQLAGEKEEVESTIEEQPLRKAPPVHSPLVKELPSQVK